MNISPVNKTIAFREDRNTSIGGVKLLVHRHEGIMFQRQHMLFNGNELSNKQTLQSIGLVNRDTIHLIVEHNGKCPVLHNFGTSKA